MNFKKVNSAQQSVITRTLILTIDYCNKVLTQNGKKPSVFPIIGKVLDIAKLNVNNS